MIGLEVEVISDLYEDECGQVSCHGEIWRAKSESEIIPAGSVGIVKSIDGMTLTVEIKK